MISFAIVLLTLSNVSENRSLYKSIRGMLQELTAWNVTSEIDWAWNALTHGRNLPTLYEAVVDFRSDYILKNPDSLFSNKQLYHRGQSPL